MTRANSQRAEPRAFHRSVGEFYRKQHVAASYAAQRYSGRGGERLVQRELKIVADLLPARGRVLDVACGIGRLGRSLGPSYELYGLDYSTAMLGQARASGRYELVHGDAFTLPFVDGSFDVVVALRLLFHFPDPGPIIRELARVTRPGGTVVFETASWSPRAGQALAAANWGPRIFIHSEGVVRREVIKAGLDEPTAVEAFLISPVLYQRLPTPAVVVLERLEALLPASWRCRRFWRTFVATSNVGESQPEGKEPISRL